MSKNQKRQRGPKYVGPGKTCKARWLGVCCDNPDGMHKCSRGPDRHLTGCSCSCGTNRPGAHP